MANMVKASDLRALADTIWAELEDRYHGDPDLGLAKSLERKLADMNRFLPSPAATFAEPSTDLNAMITSVSIRLFKDEVPEPEFGKDMVERLRKAGVDVPGKGRAATAKVTNVYVGQPHLFKKFEGTSESAAAKWHLQPGV